MSTPCEQEDVVRQLVDYTGLNPLVNGKSLRGQIEELRRVLQRATQRQNMLFIVVATIIITLVTVSTWATRNDAATVMRAAEQISVAAQSIKSAQP